MGGNTTLAVSPGNTEIIAGSIAQSSQSSITVAGGGTLWLNADNSTTDGYSGGTTVKAGATLAVSADTAVGASASGMTLDNGTLLITGTTFNTFARPVTLASGGGTVNVYSSANTLVTSTPITGPGSLHKAGAGFLVLTGRSTFTGPTTVDNGVLVLDRPTDATGGTLVGTSGITVNNGGLLRLGNAAGHYNVLGGGGPGNSIPTITLNTGGIVTTLSNTTHNLNVLNFVGGTLNGAAIAPAPFASYTLNGDVNADATAGESIIGAPAGVALRGQINFNVSAGYGKLYVSNRFIDEPGTTGGVTKIGQGLLTLAGSNSYSAPTNVNVGTLALASGASLASGLISVATSGTFVVEGSLASYAVVNDAGNITFSGNTGTTSLNRAFQTLSVGTNSTAVADSSAFASAPQVLHPNNLGLSATSKLDLTNNELITAATIPQIRAQTLHRVKFRVAAGGVPGSNT